MNKQVHFALAAAFAALLAPGVSSTAFASTQEEVKALREEVRELRERYERRIEALERLLRQRTHAGAETGAGGTQSVTGSGVPATQPPATPSPPVQTGYRGSDPGAFNPGISLILNGTYGSLSRDPARYQIRGFAPTGGEVAPPARGLSLGESELILSANVDRYFRGVLIAALSPEDGIGVEEGYVQTLGLSNGFSVKAGRFFSGVGYLNEIHAHAWDFVDAPLANKVFLGNQLAEDGVQLKWVAPTDLYFDLGVEAGRGRKFPAGPDGGRSKNGFGSGTLFAHLGGDIGASTAWRIGLSQLRTSPQARSYEDADAAGVNVTNAFSGRSRLWVLDGVLKWAPHGNPVQTNFKLQGEYFRRDETGALTYDSTAASLGTQTGAYASRQSGWYLQGVYQFMPQWRAGYRHDQLRAGSTALGLVDSGVLAAANFPILGAYNPTRNSFMVDWSGTEFSRVRLQFARERSQPGLADNQIFLQYIMSLGAHGAHRF